MQQKLVGISEIAEMARPPVTKQAVANWRVRYADFPRPVETLQSGPVWDSEVIKNWLDQKKGRGTIVISFINLKGGVAKTTTSVAVAEILAKELRKQVLFIDLDPQTNATINLIGEEEWKKRNAAGLTLSRGSGNRHFALQITRSATSAYQSRGGHRPGSIKCGGRHCPPRPFTIQHRLHRRAGQTAIRCDAGEF